MQFTRNLNLNTGFPMKREPDPDNMVRMPPGLKFAQYEIKPQVAVDFTDPDVCIKFPHEVERFLRANKIIVREQPHFYAFITPELGTLRDHHAIGAVKQEVSMQHALNMVISQERFPEFSSAAEEHCFHESKLIREALQGLDPKLPLGKLVAQVMRKLKGKANPGVVNEIVHTYKAKAVL